MVDERVRRPNVTDMICSWICSPSGHPREEPGRSAFKIASMILDEDVPPAPSWTTVVDPAVAEGAALARLVREVVEVDAGPVRQRRPLPSERVVRPSLRSRAAHEQPVRTPTAVGPASADPRASLRPPKPARSP